MKTIKILLLLFAAAGTPHRKLQFGTSSPVCRTSPLAY